jgi:endonuclease/exonuclease/phosphatase (EEP) superfamily protein YafD
MGFGLLGLLLIVGTMTTAGFFSQYSFYCELASHLRLIYIPALAACVVAGLLTRRRLVATASLALLCANVWAVAGLYGEAPHLAIGARSGASESDASTGAGRADSRTGASGSDSRTGASGSDSRTGTSGSDSGTGASRSRSGTVASDSGSETGASGSSAETSAGKTDHSVKIMSINLWGGKNRQFDQAIAEIKRNDPDVIGFSEITWLWWKKLEPALINYPYRSMELKYGGIAVFSRLPLKDSHIEYFGAKKRPRVATKCKMGDIYVNLLVVHPFAPLKEFKQRNLELKELGTEVKQMNAPVVLVGDINCSPWSFYFTQLLKDSALQDSEQGFGAQPSWPAIRNHALIPIDHCLVSKDIQVINRQIGRNIGSDHLPVVIELQNTFAKKITQQISFNGF